MATITTLNSGDNGSTSRGVINTNFSNLNTAATATVTGLVPTPPNDTTKFLRGDATWNVPTLLYSPTIYSAVTTTLSITTNGSQKVVVWAKGQGSGIAGTATASLKYDGVTKDTTVYVTNGTATPFTLMYTETPAVGTQNITVTCTDTITNVSIIALVF